MKATAPFGIDSSKQAAHETRKMTPSTGTSGKSKFFNLASRLCLVSPSASATRNAARAPLLSGMASMPSPQVSRNAAARSQAHPPTCTFTRNASAPFAANAASRSDRVRTTRGVLTARSAARNAAPALPRRGLDALDRAGGCVVGTCRRRGTKLAESGFRPSLDSHSAWCARWEGTKLVLDGSRPRWRSVHCVWSAIFYRGPRRRRLGGAERRPCKESWRGVGLYAPHFAVLALALLQEAICGARPGLVLRSAGAQVRASLWALPMRWASAPSLASSRPGPVQLLYKA